MPSGKTHALISVIAAGGLAFASYSAARSDSVTWALAGGSLAGILLTPDLDVDHPVRSHNLVRQNLGLLPYAVWRILWYPYARMIPHRHWTSHLPVISTLLRVLYLAGVLLPLLAILGLVAPPLAELPAWLPWALVGLGVSDLLHWAADIVTNHYRIIFRINRRRRRR